MLVIKRDGRKVAFNVSKIYSAIVAACEGSNNHLSDKDIALVATKVVDYLEQYDCKEVDVESIQNLCVKALNEYGHTTLAKKYNSYRHERNKIREQKSELLSVISKIGIETDRDNANVGNNFSAKLLRIASEANKWHMLLKLLPKDMAKNHEIGNYYIHDLDSYNLTVNCLHIPTSKLLMNGFNAGYGQINSPQSIESAAALTCIALQAAQNDMFGGQSHPNFDNDMSLYIDRTRAKVTKELEKMGANHNDKQIIEDIVFKRTCQAMQSIVFNLNSMHSRAGSQVPFSSINIGIPKNKDAALVCECFLKKYDKGLGGGEQPIFPNIIFRVKDGVNKKPSDPYYCLLELAASVASRRMNPTFMNMDADFNKKYYDIGILPATMGCRTYLMTNINGAPGVEGRGNNAPVTMNLVRLAITANQNLDLFFKNLDSLIEECHLQLLHRYETVKKLKVKDLPFVTGQKLMCGSENLGPSDSIDNIVKNGTWGIGFIGLAETLKLLTGKHHGESEESQKLGVKIVTLIRQRCDEYTLKYKLNFSCYATPAEGLSGKFTELDKKQFSNIDWIISKGFYTNSFHVPVDFNISIADKLRIEAPYHALCNGGHISYVEFDNYPSKEDVLKVVDYAYSKTNISYIGVNFHIRYCQTCCKK